MQLLILNLVVHIVTTALQTVNISLALPISYGVLHFSTFSVNRFD
jgi:hypothetical protein